MSSISHPIHKPLSFEYVLGKFEKFLSHQDQKTIVNLTTRIIQNYPLCEVEKLCLDIQSRAKDQNYVGTLSIQSLIALQCLQQSSSGWVTGAKLMSQLNGFNRCLAKGNLGEALNIVKGISVQFSGEKESCLQKLAEASLTAKDFLTATQAIQLLPEGEVKNTLTAQCPIQKGSFQKNSNRLTLAHLLNMFKEIAPAGINSGNRGLAIKKAEELSKQWHNDATYSLQDFENLLREIEEEETRIGSDLALAHHSLAIVLIKPILSAAIFGKKFSALMEQQNFKEAFDILKNYVYLSQEEKDDEFKKLFTNLMHEGHKGSALLAFSYIVDKSKKTRLAVEFSLSYVAGVMQPLIPSRLEVNFSEQPGLTENISREQEKKQKQMDCFMAMSIPELKARLDAINAGLLKLEEEKNQALHSLNPSDESIRKTLDPYFEAQEEQILIHGAINRKQSATSSSSSSSGQVANAELTIQPSSSASEIPTNREGSSPESNKQNCIIS